MKEAISFLTDVLSYISLGFGIGAVYVFSLADKKGQEQEDAAELEEYRELGTPEELKNKLNKLKKFEEFEKYAF